MNITCLKVAIGVALMGMNGCSLIPEYHRPEAPVQQSWNAPYVTSTNARQVTWQAVFKSEMLDDLISQALVNNRDLRVAALNIEKTQAQYRIRKADLLPSINASGSANS